MNKVHVNECEYFSKFENLLKYLYFNKNSQINTPYGPENFKYTHVLVTELSQHHFKHLKLTNQSDCSFSNYHRSFEGCTVYFTARTQS